MPTQQRLLSLKTPQINYTPVQFQAAEYKPVETDMTLLANSVNMLEQRKIKSDAAYNALQTKLGELDNKFHNDNETNTWWTNRKNKIIKDIRDLTSTGDYGAALSQATRLAGDVAADTEINTRIQANTNLEEDKKRLKELKDSGKITSIREERYLHEWESEFNNNEHSYLEYDDNGNVIGLKNVQRSMPSQGMSFADVLKHTLTISNPEEESRSSTVSSSTQNSRDGNSSGRSSERGSSRSVKRLTVEKITEAIRQFYKSNPEALKALEDEFKDAKFQLEKDKDKLNTLDPNSVEYNMLQAKIKADEEYFTAWSGTNVDLIDWALKRHDKEIQAAAFSSISTSSTSRSSSNNSVNTRGSGSSGGSSGGSDGTGGGKPTTPSPDKPKPDSRVSGPAVGRSGGSGRGSGNLHSGNDIGSNFN